MVRVKNVYSAACCEIKPGAEGFASEEQVSRFPKYLLPVEPPPPPPPPEELPPVLDEAPADVAEYQPRKRGKH